MVGDHVPERAGALIKLAAPLDSDDLGGRDLHMIDVPAIPDRLEQSVGKAQRHHVLHRFLTQEMVDSINLMLAKRPEDFGVERFCGSEVMAERLLDNDPAPPALLLPNETCSAEVGDGAAEQPVRDG